jgi:topoisomerase-4 subunit A
VITVILRQVGTIKKLKFDIDFASLSIKGRASKGIYSKYPIKKIEIKEKEFLPYYQEKYGTMIPSKIECDERELLGNLDPMIKF